MNKWEKFEQDCVEFLNKTYGMYARFTHKGGADLFWWRHGKVFAFI